MVNPASDDSIVLPPRRLIIGWKVLFGSRFHRAAMQGAAY